MYLLSEPEFKFWGSNTFRLTSDDRYINAIFQALQGFGKIPGMCITITSGRQVFYPERTDCPGFCTEVRDINDDEFFCDFLVKQGENKVGASKSCIDYFDPVRKRYLFEFFHYCGSKSIIRKEGISASGHYDLGVQHRLHSLDELLGNYPLVIIYHDHVRGT